MIITIILVLLIIYIIFTYNSLIKKQNKVEEAFGGIEAYLQERFDNISTQAEIVKEFAEHEHKVLTDVIQLRKGGYVPRTFEEKVQLEEKLNSAVSLINALAEEYPDIKSSENFLQLQQTVNVIEDKISASRRAYNMAVRKLNDAIEVFPNNLIVLLFGNKFKALKMFEAQEQAKSRVNVSEVFKK